jgi:subtilisin-like proprotein convertase family protein
VAGYTNPNPLDFGAHQCVTSTLTINDQFAIGRLLAGVNLNHPNRADLTIRLLSPGPVRTRLLGPAANSGQHLDTLFDDSKTQGVPVGNHNPASPFYTPAYQPVTPLSQFVGVGVKGNWRLEICNSGSSNGTLNRWIIVIPEITDFKVYMPNIRRNK